METAAPEVSPSDNVDSSLPKEPPTEVEVAPKVGVNSANELDKDVTSEKELSWEKIAAEIVQDDAENPTQISEETSAEIVESVESVEVKEEEEEQEGTIEETVINSVTDEKVVTEADNSDVIPDSTEEKNEEIVQEAPATEEPESVVETAPIEEPSATEEPESLVETAPVEEVPVSEEVAVPVNEVEVQESSEAVPVDEVEESEAPEEITGIPEPESTPETPEKLKEDEAVVEISEVKSDEVVESVETTEDLEYTVVEAEDVETNEIIEEHIAQTNNSSKSVTETVVIINPDQSQTEITIEQVNEDDRSDENSQSYTEEIYLVTKDSESVDDPTSEQLLKQQTKPKKPRGRKPISDIPLHVLGRDITKPTEGVSNGGRTMPKPRLGVKVPYRNLTSQIVSKQEIEKEIMERFKIKQEQNVTNSGDILFARKLTQRLAKKLIPTEKDKEKTTIEMEEPSSSLQEEQVTSEIKNNSDLIAILEGEGDEIDLTKKKEHETKEKEVKKTEREIALEQLKELPGKSKIFKSKEEDKKPATPQKEVQKVKPATSAASPQKSNVEKKNQLEVEPRLKPGAVIKTYTRKRKSTDFEPILPPKKSAVATPIKTEDGSPSAVYVTKSSRVIKRKVIWDPDEVPSKSPVKVLKVETPVKPVEKKEPVEKIQEKRTPSPVKKLLSKTPIILKKPKRLTEVDKLLMDEGAVNMLYDVKTNDETSPKKKTNKSVISLDKAHKELMSKTNVIKNDLQQNTNKDVQKSLRKKEIVSPTAKKEVKKEATPSGITRKKSKDSARSSVHSPPASPPYNAAEASRIIRRHSSSSFSSNDESGEEGDEERTTKKKGSVSESPKKKTKKVNENKPKDAAKNNNNTVTESKENKNNHVDKTVTQYTSFVVTKKNKLVSLKLQSVDGKCYLNEQVLKELISCLKDFGKDDDCHVVSITSDNNESFCEGLDYRILVAEDDSARKKKATELAALVKEFLRCLLNFPKVIVAGIQGDCVGLGVTMLPLFDMVIASDTSTFSTPYSRLGCVPEAGFLLTVPHLSSNGLASELLYASQTIKADDAFRKGLVSRLCWPEKYQQEFKLLLSQVAIQPRQSMMATKQQLRQDIIESTETALSSVSKVLVEYWTSPECQKNFAK